MINSDTERFVVFIDTQLAKKGWSDYKLAKIAKLSPSVISRARSGILPKWDACVKIAQGLGLPSETVFRATGLLPQLPEETEEIRWFTYVYPHLDTDDQQEIHTLIELKIRRKFDRENGEN